MKSLTVPADRSTPNTEDKGALAARMPRTESPEPRFRTVLVPGSGWPTEACVPVARKRAPKR